MLQALTKVVFCIIESKYGSPKPNNHNKVNKANRKKNKNKNLRNYRQSVGS